MTLSTTMKVFLIIIAIIAFLLAALIGSTILLFNANKGDLEAMANKIGTEAQDFAEDKNQQDCVKETTSKLNSCYGLSCRIESIIFMRICLDEAKPSPDLCTNIPPIDNMIDTAKWRVEQCESMDMNDDHCRSFIGKLQEYCNEL
jgi:hypothetical protein